MKTVLLTYLILMTATARAEFSAVVIGHDSRSKIHNENKEIILTFDDGPTPGVTNKILTTLKRYNIKAAFFVQADNAKNYPDLMERIVNEGHIVANHSYTHKVLSNLDNDGWKQTLKKEVLDAHEVIVPYMTISNRFYYRAPGGYWEKRFAQVLNLDAIAMSYTGPVQWDVGGEVEIKGGRLTKAADWECWRKKIPVGECLSGYVMETRQRSGGVILMHDVSVKTAEMLSHYIPVMKQNGYSFRTLDDVNWDR